MVLAPGETIDIWVVEKALGTGGMGSVYRCHNRSATRILAAVKVLDATLAKAKGAEERFIREAEILFRVDHPNVVKVRNIRTDTDPPYLEMEFVAGESLESVLQQGPLPLPRALALFGQLVDAVGYLHDLGIRHRDIKPQNVLVRPDGTLKLVDFGLAMEADASRITQQGTTFGTVSYAPPEWVNESLDPIKWDLYALGVVAWEMLTGDVAFPVSGQGSSRQQAMQVMLAKQNHAPLDPGEGFPPALRALIGDLTLSDPNKRIGDAAEVIERLRLIEPRLELAARLPSGSPRREAATWVDLSGRARIVDGKLVTDTPHDPPETSAARRLAPLSQTFSLEPPVAAPRRRFGAWIAASLGAAVVVGSLGLAVMGLAAVALWPPGPRDVAVTIRGLPDRTPVALTIDGQAPAFVEAGVARFPTLAIGTHRVSTAVGAACEPCLHAQACPVWCDVGESAPIEVEAGFDAQAVTLTLAALQPRPVPITLTPAYPGVRVWVAGVEAAIDADGRGAIALTPGTFPTRLTTCAAPCPAAGCPADCAELLGEVIVPAHGDASIALTSPAAWAPPTAVLASSPPSAPKPKPPPDTPPAEGTRASARITNHDFATWLTTHASEWSKDAAIAAGRAEGSYLDGWTDTAPPAGKDRSAALNISWYAADAYCRGRGGLANVDAEPLQWDDRLPPNYEWRQTNDGAPMFRGADGTQGLERSKKSTNSLTGFRCAR